MPLTSYIYSSRFFNSPPQKRGPGAPLSPSPLDLEGYFKALVGMSRLFFSHHLIRQKLDEKLVFYQFPLFFFGVADKSINQSFLPYYRPKALSFPPLKLGGGTIITPDMPFMCHDCQLALTG